MDEKEEQELVEKGLRYRPTIKEATTYIVDSEGNEIKQTLTESIPKGRKGIKTEREEVKK